jgi:hypothetical protein
LTWFAKIPAAPGIGLYGTNTVFCAAMTTPQELAAAGFDGARTTMQLLGMLT